MNKSSTSTLELILQFVEQRLRDQHEAIDHLMVRVNLIVGFFGIILAALVQSGVDTSLPSFVKFALVLLFFALATAMCAYRVRSFRNDPNPEILYRKYRNHNKDFVIKTLSLNIIDSFNENKRIMAKTNGFLLISMSLFVLSSLMIILYFLREEVKSLLWQIIQILE